MRFIVTEEMATTLWDDYENRECDSPDTTQGDDRRWALQSFVDRHNLRPVVDEAPGLLMESAPTGPVGVFRHAKGAINLAHVKEWFSHGSITGAIWVQTGVGDEGLIRMDGTDAARFIDIFSRWAVR